IAAQQQGDQPMSRAFCVPFTCRLPGRRIGLFSLLASVALAISLGATCAADPPGKKGQGGDPDVEPLDLAVTSLVRFGSTVRVTVKHSATKMQSPPTTLSVRVEKKNAKGQYQ